MPTVFFFYTTTNFKATQSTYALKLGLKYVNEKLRNKLYTDSQYLSSSLIIFQNNRFPLIRVTEQSRYN